MGRVGRQVMRQAHLSSWHISGAYLIAQSTLLVPSISKSGCHCTLPRRRPPRARSRSSPSCSLQPHRDATAQPAGWAAHSGQSDTLPLNRAAAEGAALGALGAIFNDADLKAAQ